ncbi:MAG: hypothetical protein ACE5KR_03025 [Candidatus Bipolaricaulia bacterium]
MVKSRGFVRDILVIAAATATSRLFGLFRDVVIADRFGASAAYDAYIIAFFVPHVLRQLLAEGAPRTTVATPHDGQAEEPPESPNERMCPRCKKGRLVLVDEFPAIAIHPPKPPFLDTS